MAPSRAMNFGSNPNQAVGENLDVATRQPSLGKGSRPTTGIGRGIVEARQAAPADSRAVMR
jgi:hypothetical protein